MVTADNPPQGTPLEQARNLAAKRVELAATAATALTALADGMAPHEMGFADANALAIGVDKLLTTLRKAVPR